MNKYTIYCPLRVADGDGTPMGYAFNVVGILTDKLTEAFGGCTVDNSDAYGYWSTPEGDIVLEHVAMVHVVVDEDAYELWRAHGVPICKWLTSYTNQKSLMVTREKVEVISGL